MSRNVHPTPFIIRPSDEFAKNIDLRNLSRSLATKYADRHVVTDDDLQIMGRMLWNALDVQDDFDAAQKAAGDAILSVIIESDKPEVQAYPWETLYHLTHKFIGRNPAFTLTRRIAEGKPSQTSLDKGPLRVLLFTSLPDNVDAERGRLNVEEEQAQVQEALMPWIAKGVVQLEMPDDGRFSTLKDLLQRFDPHVLFLSGHGKFHHEPHADEAYGEFWFESETGDVEKIRDEEIARALSETRVQAVILSACESGKAVSDYLSNGLMQQISAAGIPHVIGMRESILDVAGIQFARALCDALAGRERLDVALQSARMAIQSAMNERGQWCLPMVLSPNPQSQIIDWDFQSPAVEAQQLNQRMNTVSLPARFVGRRAEMRRYKIKLTQGALRSLLITGTGGMGKTSLAGKLALDMQSRGWKFFAWGADSKNSWQGFEIEELHKSLYTFRQDRYKEEFAKKQPSEIERTKFLLKELSEQFNGRVILFFDNLETLQDADSLVVKDATVAAWMQAARGTDGVTVFATSRWQIPDWDGECLMLARANYGDFLQIAAMKNLPIRREQMRRVYDALGGNIRGLEFFAAAAQSMDDENAEEAFLQSLEQTKSDLQANMAITEIYNRLPDDAKKLLARLPAYHEPVPMDGLLKLGTGFPDAEKLLERLLAVSLLEASDNLQWNATEYQVVSIMKDWMSERSLIDNNLEWLNAVADFHMYLHKSERNTVGHAITTHNALRRAERHDEADRLTMSSIVGRFVVLGLYTALLTEWLPPICNSQDLEMRCDALGRTGSLLISIGDYQTALNYLKQSLAIRQQLGDKVGEGSALGNISQIYQTQCDFKTALSYLMQSLAIFQQIEEKAGEAAALSNISRIYYMQGDYETALAYNKQSLVIFQQLGDKIGEGSALGNISQIYQIQGDYETALTYLKQSLIIERQIGDKVSEGKVLGNISTFYYEQGDYDTSTFYMKQSLAIMQQIDDKDSESILLNNMSQIYRAQGDYETALEYLEQSVAISKEIGNRAAEAATINNISEIYFTQGDTEAALVNLKQSIAIRQQIGDKAGLCDAFFNMGHICIKNNQLQDAISAWVNSYIIAKQIGYARVLQALAKLALQLGSPEGLDGWEILTQRMEDRRQNELEQINRLVQMVAKVVRSNSVETAMYFKHVSKMAVDSNAPSEYQELGKVLRNYMAGVKNPDLSRLTEEIRQIVEDELENK